jgi:hypothetical protein
MSSIYAHKIRELADHTTDTELADALYAIANDPAQAAWEFVTNGVYLGAHEEWSGADMLEAIAMSYPGVGIPVGDGANIDGWRQLADHLGYDHDGEPEDEPEDEDDSDGEDPEL